MITIQLLLTLVCTFYSCGEDDAERPAAGTDEKPTWGTQTPVPVVDGQAAFRLSAEEDYVNVMENLMPRIPVFPKAKAKEGKMVGFVADLSGKPLQGAYIGVRSTVVGGTYSSASAERDENGYYEILVPFGAAEIWAAGY